MNSVLKSLLFFVLISVVFFAASQSLMAEPVDKENIIISQLWENRNNSEDRSNKPGDTEKQTNRKDEMNLPDETGPEGRSDEPPSYDREDGEYPVYN